MFTAESFQLGTAALWINKVKAPINMDGRRADISAYVKPGENTIEVRVTSSLRNIMREVGYDRGCVILWQQVNRKIQRFCIGHGTLWDSYLYIF